MCAHATHARLCCVCACLSLTLCHQAHTRVTMYMYVCKGDTHTQREGGESRTLALTYTPTSLHTRTQVCRCLPFVQRIHKLDEILTTAELRAVVKSKFLDYKDVKDPRVSRTLTLLHTCNCALMCVPHTCVCLHVRVRACVSVCGHICARVQACAFRWLHANARPSNMR